MKFIKCGVELDFDVKHTRDLSFQELSGVPSMEAQRSVLSL